MNTIKASEIETAVPGGATHIALNGFGGKLVIYSNKHQFYKNVTERTYEYWDLDRAGWVRTSGMPHYEVAEILYDTEFVPEVGMKCEVFFPDDVLITGLARIKDGDVAVVNALFARDNGNKMAAVEVLPNGHCDVILERCLRPIKSEEDKQFDLMMNKWKAQSLDTAHDTRVCKYSLESVFEFLIKAGAKLPEGEQ